MWGWHKDWRINSEKAFATDLEDKEKVDTKIVASGGFDAFNHKVHRSLEDALNGEKVYAKLDHPFERERIDGLLHVCSKPQLVGNC